MKRLGDLGRLWGATLEPSSRLGYDRAVIQCFNCGFEYDGTRFRWLCPQCGMKDTCCDGEACQPRTPSEE